MAEQKGDYVEHLKAEHTAFLKSLPIPLLQSVIEYTKNRYADINSALRKSVGEPTFRTPEVKQDFDNIERVFSLLPPITESITVYRGVKAKSSVGVDNDHPRNVQKSYLSTTLNKEKTLLFTAQDSKFNRETGWDDWCCIMQYTVSPGSKALFVGGVSAHKGEEEILLHRNGTLMLTGFQERNVSQGIMRDTFYITYLPDLHLGVQQSDLPTVSLLVASTRPSPGQKRLAITEADDLSRATKRVRSTKDTNENLSELHEKIQKLQEKSEMYNIDEFLFSDIQNLSNIYARLTLRTGDDFAQSFQNLQLRVNNLESQLSKYFFPKPFKN